MRKTTTALVCVGILAVLASPGPAQCDETRIDSPSVGMFGFRVEMSGNRLALGNPTDHDHPGGASYVYRQEPGGWVQEAVLVGSDTAPLDSAGRGIAMHGDRVVVGAPSDNRGGKKSAGSAYVFVDTSNGWVEEQKLVAPKPVTGALLGGNVAIHGDVIVLGAYQDEVAGVVTGSAYVFRHVGGSWVLETLLTASDGSELDHFGYDVAVHEDVIVVGARNKNDGVGAVYFFRWNGTSWEEEGWLPGSGRHQLGWAVDVDGDTAVASSPVFGAFTQGKVSVYQYDGSAWTRETDLIPSTARRMLSMGWSVALDGDTIVAGAPERSISVRYGPGAAFVYRRLDGAWVEAAELLASDGFVNMWLGQAVSVTDSTIVASTLFGQRAYSWDLIPDPARAETYGEGLPGLLGEPFIGASARPALGTQIEIEIGNSRGESTFGILVCGANEADIPAFGGTLLVVPDIILPVNLPAAGFVFDKDIPCDPALSGLTHNLQTLMLDPAALRGVSFTKGLKLVFGW